MQVKLRSNYRVQVSKRVHVSRIVPSPSRGIPVVLVSCVLSSVPDRVTHSTFSSCVTAVTDISAPTSLSLARIGLSCLRAIAVTHY
jgi:hypothetical protein